VLERPPDRRGARPAHTGSESVDLREELAAARAREQRATAEIEQLQQRVQALRGWLEAAAENRRVEYMRAKRRAIVEAAKNDRVYSFLVSLPWAFALLYCIALVVVIWLFVAHGL